MALETPVALILFNRPDLTRRTFEAIAGARPKKLLLIADGPRPDHAGEAERCQEARRIVERIDWPCDLQQNYSSTNLGCRRRVSSGLDWIFERENEAIVLEDDCVPDPTFFPYCSTLLERYRDEDRVVHISGTRPGVRSLDTTPGVGASYWFSKYPQIWGWATWRRAWQNYDVTMRDWPPFAESREFRKFCPDKVERQYWRNVFEKVYQGTLDTWDVQWLLACWRSGGLSATPFHNLIRNEGFRPDATHTKSDHGGNLCQSLEPLETIAHPNSIKADRAADRRVFNTFYGGQYLRSRGMLGRLKRMTPQSLSSVFWGRMMAAGPGTGPQRLLLKMRAFLVRHGDPVVRIRIDGTPVYLRLSHQLPRYKRLHPYYDTSLCRLAAFEKKATGSLVMIDVGANVGDTMLSVAAKTPGRFLCIEGDPCHFELLMRNARSIGNSVTCECVLCGASDKKTNLTVQRGRGTSVFSEDNTGKSSYDMKTIDSLVCEHPDFKAVNLIKIDTDGYDLQVLRGAADILLRAQPMVFFEFEPRHLAQTESDPLSIFPFLRALGYQSIYLYNNRGLPMAAANTLDLDTIRQLLHRVDMKEIHYYDIIAVPKAQEEIAAGFWENEIATVNPMRLSAPDDGGSIP